MSDWDLHPRRRKTDWWKRASVIIGAIGIMTTLGSAGGKVLLWAFDQRVAEQLEPIRLDLAAIKTALGIKPLNQIGSR